jgi:hypothetical protein
MKLLIKIIIIIILVSPLSCFKDDDEDCVYPMDISYGARVIGAGSIQYNGDYDETGWIINNHAKYEKSGTLYTIEYDLIYDWSIKDNGVVQYYAPGCDKNTPYQCTSNPFIVLNGDIPAPTTERLHYWLPAKCGM